MSEKTDADGDRPCDVVVDAVVLGAGVSGLVSASILLDQGASRVAVVDQYDRVGGNHIDQTCAGYTFDIGSLVFQDDSPLLRHFPEILSRYVPIDPSWGKITPQGVVTDYPFSVRHDIVTAGPLECLRMVRSLIHARLFRRRMHTAHDFARYWIGARLLHRSGLEHYMERFCGLPADKIDLRFAQKRMMWIAQRSSPRGMVRTAWRSVTRARPPAATNRQLVRPREGFTTLYQPAVHRLENAGVTFDLGVGLRSVRRTGDTFRVNTDRHTFVAKRLVSTIPIDVIRGLCDIPIDHELPTVTLISLFFSFTGRRGFAPPILYNFTHHGAWKRLTMHSDFYGPTDDREFFAVEVIGDGVENSAQVAEHDFRRHVAENGLFAGDLRLEGTHVLPHAYPIYTDGAGERADRAVAALRDFGVESLGRQGAFEYQPTARTATMDAEAALGAEQLGAITPNPNPMYVTEQHVTHPPVRSEPDPVVRSAR